MSTTMSQKKQTETKPPRESKSPQDQDESQPETPVKKANVPPVTPVLRFSPTAWAKLLYFRDRGQTEIGGFGVSAENNPLYIEDFVTVEQEATSASISFDDEAVADFFDQQVDLGRKPGQFARLWMHTHPGTSPVPSHVDEETFQRVFGRCQWAVMFVLARGGKTYARLRFNVGPGGQAMIPVEVDYSGTFEAADHEAWEAEYKAHIRARQWLCDFDTTLPSRREQDVFGAEPDEAGFVDWEADDWIAALEELAPEERRAVLEELASRPDIWHEAEEVMPW